MKKIFTLFFLVAALNVSAQTYFALSGGPYTQNWTSNVLTTNDDWTPIPNIRGFLGQDITTLTGVDPQTLSAVSLVASDLDLIANQTAPNTLTSGGVAEFEITDPTIALQGSGTGDAPYIVLYLNTTGREHIRVSYNLRDIDGSADNAIQPVALQYRVGNSGPFINIPEAFVADATSGPSLATMVTAVSAVLPADADNQAMVEVRIITTNAVGSDEWVGVDDIVVSQGWPFPLSLVSFDAAFNNNAVNVKWSTTNEINVAGFEVERSVNGKDFKTIGTVESKGSLAANNYSFVDERAVKGLSYYRLKMNDRDGAFKYSQAVIIKVKSEGVSIYPNPVKSDITIQHDAALQGATVAVMDFSGKQVLSVNVQAGAVQTSLSAARLAPGTYMIVYNNDGVRSTKQFIKQ
jgi:hypothetical protein